MAQNGKMTPKEWGPFMPAHAPLQPKGPWYYRGCECIIIEYTIDVEEALAILPSDFELFEPATGFMYLADNHRSSFGRYGELYNGILCTFEGNLCAYVPGVYVTGENSQIVGREIWGFGKKRADRIEFIHRLNGEIHVEMDINEGDRAFRAAVRPTQNLPAEALGSVQVVCLRIVPDAEGSDVPALAQLCAEDVVFSPLKGDDGKDEVFDCEVVGFANGISHAADLAPVDILGAKHAMFNCDLPYGKVLKTYSDSELRAILQEA